MTYHTYTAQNTQEGKTCFCRQQAVLLQIADTAYYVCKPHFFPAFGRVTIMLLFCFFHETEVWIMEWRNFFVRCTGLHPYIPVSDLFSTYIDNGSGLSILYIYQYQALVWYISYFMTIYRDTQVPRSVVCSAVLKQCRLWHLEVAKTKTISYVTVLLQ